MIFKEYVYSSGGACDSSSYPACSSAYAIANGETKSNMCGTNQYYKITTTQTCDIKWTLTPSNADYDLYTKWPNNACPSLTGWDCRPYAGGSTQETCTKTQLPAGTYNALVNKYSGTGTYSINVQATNCSSGCTDECSFGQKRCNGSYSQTCGNYNTDTCYEWPASTSGSGNEFCSNSCNTSTGTCNAPATETGIDQQNNQPINVSANGGFGSSMKVTQSFVPSKTATVAKVRFPLSYLFGTANNIILNIETDTSGNPSGQLVSNGCTTTINGFTNPAYTNYSWLDFAFNEGCVLYANTKYWLVISSPSSSSQSSYVVYLSTTNTYQNGVGKYNNGNWNEWNPNYDLIFQEYIWVEPKNCGLANWAPFSWGSVAVAYSPSETSTYQSFWWDATRLNNFKNLDTQIPYYQYEIKRPNTQEYWDFIKSNCSTKYFTNLPNPSGYWSEEVDSYFNLCRIEPNPNEEAQLKSYGAANLQAYTNYYSHLFFDRDPEDIGKMLEIQSESEYCGSNDDFCNLGQKFGWCWMTKQNVTS